MKICKKLISFRKFNKLEEEQVAELISIELEDYRAFEAGLLIITTEIANKLSDLFQVPPYLFIEEDNCSSSTITYSHCNFENSIGYVNYLHHEKNELKELIKDLILELQSIKNQNELIISFLLDKSKTQDC
jgi:transcriptional regulator with XRE-family HTH domain